MWGSESWGEMIWGGGAPGVPLMGPVGFAALALCLLLGGSLALRARRPHWRTWMAGSLLVAALLLFASLLPRTTPAATIDVPYDFSNGTVADADQVNANFDTLVTESNAQDARIAILEATDVTNILAGAGLLGGGSAGAIGLDVDTSYVQRRVSSACPLGQSIQTINADGSVVCHLDIDTNTTYSAGAGIVLLGTTFSVDTSTTQSRVTGSCPAGSAIRAVAADGSVTCEASSDTTCGSSGTCTTVYGDDFEYPSPQARTVVIGPERMIHRAGGPRSLPSNGPWYVFNKSDSFVGTERYMDAAISEIPNGATIEGITCRVYDSIATYEVGVNLYECGSSSCTSKLTGDWCYTGEPGGCSSDPSAVLNLEILSPPMTPFVLDSATNSYHISYYTSITGGTNCGAFCRFYNCAIDYTVAGPQ